MRLAHFIIQDNNDQILAMVTMPLATFYDVWFSVECTVATTPQRDLYLITLK